MVVDLKKVTLSRELDIGTLWVIEQIPGLVVGADQTTILRAGLLCMFFSLAVTIAAWGTGAHALSTSNCLIFLVTSEVRRFNSMWLPTQKEYARLYYSFTTVYCMNFIIIFSLSFIPLLAANPVMPLQLGGVTSDLRGSTPSHSTVK